MQTERDPLSVSDKVVLLTGATGLIGKGITTSLLNRGAKVVVGDIDKNALAAFEKELSTRYEDNAYICLHLDIANVQSIQEAVQKAVEKYSKIDVLINNAAIDAKFDHSGIHEVNHSRFEYYPVELLNRSIEVNMVGTIQMTQYVCRQMLSQGYGHIINLASTYSLVAPNQDLYNFGDDAPIRYKPIDYVATKSFIPNFTRYLATFYAKENIRCNAIAPHGIFNNHDEKFQQNFAKYSPLGRMCDLSEITGAFIFLCSDASSYMTGSVLVVDGGWTAW